jgi:hypothetical protein
MRVIHFLSKTSLQYLLLAILALMASAFITACSAVRQRVHDIVRVPPAATRAYRQGRAEAQVDLAQGRVNYRTYGMPMEWDGPDLYAQRLRNDYNIELVVVAGCEINEDLVNRTQGYNDVALPFIEARYGEGILERVRQQAVDEWKRTHESK